MSWVQVDMNNGRRDWRPQVIAGVPDGLVLFDGVCVLCSGWVRYIVEHDPAARFRFAAIQNPYGTALATQLGIDIADPETNAVVFGGMAYFKSDALLAVLSRLPRLGWTRAFGVLPRAVRDCLYNLVARSRYRVFGRTDQCLMPTPELMARFVDHQPVNRQPAAAGE